MRELSYIFWSLNLDMKTISLDELQSRFPTTIDDVIGRRDLVTLRLAVPEDLAALPPGVSQTEPPKMRLKDWYVVVVDKTDVGERLTWSLFGTHAVKGGTYCTSYLERREGNRFRTHSGSLYEVIGEPSTEPDLAFVCGWLNYLGVGEELGVLPIFL